ncbi:latrophilin-like protein LAT-2 [Lytechinus variegatus]|uniref:latrophilin-like protein LAT-2 n=1 Tax=Lytechinus variegatus TaxID=7654 RepID=UPI001BB156B6|nr:latrophilin-like protein LAT-2 [Lytechinus variegatus]
MGNPVLFLLLILVAAVCDGAILNETCVYNPCQNGGTCMNVLRPVGGKSLRYNDVYYLYVSDTMMTWSEASNYCHHEGGGLVGFEDKEEEKFGDNYAAKQFIEQDTTYWVSARYHGTSSQWKWYPSNETFDIILDNSTDGDCMTYTKRIFISVPERESCNATHSFVCEDYNALISQCRCPPGYSGPFCENQDEPGTPSSKSLKICEGESDLLTCALEQKVMRIEYAAYGVYDNTTCNDGHTFLSPGQKCVAENSVQKTVDVCQGQSFCDISVGNEFFQNNPCIPRKHLDLRYQCVANDPAVYDAPYPPARLEPPTMYCKMRVYGNTTYEVTAENTTVYKPCPEGYRGQVSFLCLLGGMWHDHGPDDSGCTMIRAVDNLNDEIMSGEKEAVEIAETIDDLVKDGGDTATLEDTEVVKLLTDLNELQKKQLEDTNKNTSERISTVSSYAEKTLSIASILLNSDDQDTDDTSSQKSISKNITEFVEEVAFILSGELVEDTSKTVSTDTIDMTCGSLPGGRRGALSYPTDRIFDRESMTNAQARATLPPSTFDDDPSKKNTIAIVEYKKINNIGSRTIQPIDNPDELVNQSVVNSLLLGVSAMKGDTPVKSFQNDQTFSYIMKHTNPNVTGKVSCVFVDDTNKLSTEGCRLVNTNRTHTECTCNHLTNFAILLDVTGVYEDLSVAHTTALGLLTIIGCSVSIGCLAICIFAFSFFKSLWNTRTTIHRNLCISLLTAQLLFLVGVERTEHDIVCTVIAAILHYTFLCSFAWMALEGIQLYIMLVHVFSTSGKVLPYYLAGYGLPAIVVAVAGGISKGEGYGQETYCWLSTDRGFIWSFAGPVALIILVNFVFLVVSIRIAYSGRAAVSKDATNSQNIKVWIKGAVTLTFLLGSTWGVGFFFLSGSSLPLAYAFTILNSLQGMFIFIYHCLGNERIKKEMAKFLLRQPCLPACLRVRLEAVARVGSSVYSTTQSSTAPPVNKKPDTVALTEKKKDVIHPVVYVQDIDEDDGKPRSWLYNRAGADDTKVIPSDHPEPDYY